MPFVLGVYKGVVLLAVRQTTQTMHDGGKNLFDIVNMYIFVSME